MKYCEMNYDEIMAVAYRHGFHATRQYNPDYINHYEDSKEKACYEYLQKNMPELFEEED